MKSDCKCLLCQNRTADKTGSHIVPSFIMKRINGEGQRDHEVGFAIKGSVVEPYFGRDIYEDKRREITDHKDKMESRVNYDVQDYIFCSECEKYFSKLESAYAPSMQLKFGEKQNTVNKKLTPTDALLFWCSIVWRVSATVHLGLKLSNELEERLRIALATNNTDSLNVKYALFRCKDFGKIDGKGTVACMDVRDKTILLIADDYMLVMVFDIGAGGHKAKLMDMVFNLKPESLNDGSKYEEIAPMPEHVFDMATHSMLHVAARSMHLPDGFAALHRVLTGDDLPDGLLTEMLKVMQSHSCKLGDRYTPEHYAMCYKEVMMKHGYIRDNGDKTFTFIRKH